MNRGRLYSSWIVTAMLVLIAWLAAGPQNSTVQQSLSDAADRNEPSQIRSVLAGKKIIVDPGHGGSTRWLGDYGTEGVAPRPEKENVLNVALHLRSLLVESGAEVVMTRTEDVNPAVGTPYESIPDGQLLARIETARLAGGDAFVSIHNDWHPDPTISGATTYYYHPHSESLAVSIQQHLVEARGSHDHGVRQKGFMVIRDVPMPSVLVELGYLSHPDEAYEMSDPDGQRQAAKGLYEGLVEYFSAS